MHGTMLSEKDTLSAYRWHMIAAILKTSSHYYDVAYASQKEIAW